MNNKLEALRKIIEVGSFTKAAEILGYTQSAISQMVSSLEKEFGIKLLYRSKNGIQLTPEGEEIYPYVQNLLMQNTLLAEKVTEINHLESGVVRIGAYESISRHWLPSVIKEFQTQYPKVKFVIHQGDYISIPQWIRNGEVDFGFISPDAPSGFDAELLAEDEFRIVLPKNHRLAQQASITLDEIKHEQFIFIEEGSLSEPLVAVRALGVEPDVKMWIHDDNSAVAMVEQELGISIVPALVLIGNEFDVAIKQIDPPLFRKIGIIKRDDNSLPIASKYFIDLLRRKIKF